GRGGVQEFLRRCAARRNLHESAGHALRAEPYNLSLPQAQGASARPLAALQTDYLKIVSGNRGRVFQRNGAWRGFRAARSSSSVSIPVSRKRLPSSEPSLNTMHSSTHSLVRIGIARPFTVS